VVVAVGWQSPIVVKSYETLAMMSNFKYYSNLLQYLTLEKVDTAVNYRGIFNHWPLVREIVDFNLPDLP
jgi:hypothetical protein